MIHQPSSAEILPFTAVGPKNISIIASGKGGVGKTWFAISLAHGLAKQGKKVLLFDGDLGLANVDIQLGLMPETDLGGVLSGEYDLKRAAFTYNPGGFDILAGPSGSGLLAKVSPERLALLEEELKYLAASYDHVIMDLGAGIEGTVQKLTNWGARCYVVITEDPTSLTDAYAFIKVTHQNHKKMPIQVVMNQMESHEKGRVLFQSLQKICERFLGFSPSLGGIIRRDSSVRNAIRNQTSILNDNRNAPAAGDVTKIAKEIVEEKKE